MSEVHHSHPAEWAELFSVGRSTVYRAIQRALPPQPVEKADVPRPA